MDIRKILFVTHFEELWFDALQSLLNLRQAALEHVVFLNVIEREKVALRRGAGYLKKEELRLREKANIHFIDWAETLFEQGMEVGVYIVVGSLAGQVVEAAAKEAADLIVLGDRKHGALKQFYAASELNEIARRTRIPVMVYKYPGAPHQAVAPFQRPLVAFDGGPASLRAVAGLRRLNTVIEEVHLVHVADDTHLNGDSVMAVQQTRKAQRQRLEAICEQFAEDGIPAKAHVMAGDLVERVEQAARQYQATMIVSGISLRPGWTPRWLGGRSQTLADRTGLTTLVFAPPENPATG